MNAVPRAIRVETAHGLARKAGVQRIIRGMDSDELAETWRRVQARLPVGWTLDSLRCASGGLGPEDRSDDWIAVAVDAAGGERRYRARDAAAALEGLVASFMSD